MAIENSKIHTAYHEAGHWVAADELDVLTGGISIISKDDGTAGRVGVDNDDGFLPLPDTDPYSPENERLFHEWATTQAVIDYAGHGAVVSILGLGDMSDENAILQGGWPDFQKARERLGGDADRIADAKSRAVEIVTKRKHDIELISDKLMLLRELDSQQVDVLLAGAWSLFFSEDGSFKHGSR